MAEKDELSYETISSIHRKEKKAKRLIKLDPDFFGDLISHVEKLRLEYERAHHEDPSSPTTLLLGDEFRKVKSIARDIYDRRERKVIKAVLSKVTGGNPDTNNMMRREDMLFEKLTEILKKKREETFGGRPTAKRREKEPSSPSEHTPEEGPQPDSDQTVREEESPLKEEPSRDEPELITEPPAPSEGKEGSSPIVDSMMVRILEDLDSFVASDMNTYDLHKEDVITLPRDTAMLLCTRGKAKAVPSNGR